MFPGVLAISILLLSICVEPAHGFRCGNRLIHKNDTTRQVLQRCGEPDWVEQWEEERVIRDFGYGYDAGDPFLYRSPFLVKTRVVIEVWTYNPGSTGFIRYLRFENGRLKNITTGDRGH